MPDHTPAFYARNSRVTIPNSEVRINLRNGTERFDVYLPVAHARTIAREILDRVGDPNE